MFPKGEYLCRQGEKAEFFYLLLKGKVQVDYFQVDGNRVVFSFETPFSIIGDVELFEDYQVLSNVQALEDCLTFTTSVATVREHGYDDPRFLHFILHYLFKKLYFTSTLLSHIPLSVEHRLARYLLYRMEKDGPMIQLEKRESLAAMMGTSLRHLNRTFRQLIQLEVIEVHNKTLKIIEPQIIAAIAEKGT